MAYEVRNQIKAFDSKDESIEEFKASELKGKRLCVPGFLTALFTVISAHLLGEWQKL